jgi:hypothetical protein
VWALKRSMKGKHASAMHSIFVRAQFQSVIGCSAVDNKDAACGEKSSGLGRFNSDWIIRELTQTTGSACSMSCASIRSDTHQTARIT